VMSIRRVTDLMGEISSASVEQSASVTQVVDAVTQMDKVTQQNAALVEQSAAAAESMKEQSRQLVETVAVFKLSAVATMRAVAAHAAAPTAVTVERRGPDRAKNVVRPAFGPKTRADTAPATAAASVPAKTGTDDWESF